MRAYLIGNIWYCTWKPSHRSDAAVNKFQWCNASTAISSIEEAFCDYYKLFVVGSAVGFDADKTAAIFTAAFYSSNTLSEHIEDHNMIVGEFLRLFSEETGIKITTEEIEPFVPCGIMPSLSHDGEDDLKVLMSRDSSKNIAGDEQSPAKMAEFASKYHEYSSITDSNVIEMADGFGWKKMYLFFGSVKDSFTNRIAPCMSRHLAAMRMVK
jgi:hypothetical protein